MDGGAQHTLLLSEGVVYSCGSNEDGQLGLGEQVPAQRVPTAIPVPGRAIAHISTGHAHSLCLDEQGLLWAFGYNRWGQLGLGHTQRQYQPTRVEGLPALRSVAGGGHHTVAVGLDDSLWGWGSSSHGQLGLVQDAILTPQALSLSLAGGGETVLCGHFHTLVLTRDGALWACGGNYYGQLGLGHREDVAQWTQVPLPQAMDIVQVTGKEATTLLRTGDGHVWATGANLMGQVGVVGEDMYLTFTKLPRLSGIRQLAGGRYHALAVDDQDHCWAWGSNQWGQLGKEFPGCGIYVGTPVQVRDKVQAVATGFYTSFLHALDGTLWASGMNQSGELALSGTEPQAGEEEEEEEEALGMNVLQFQRCSACPGEGGVFSLDSLASSDRWHRVARGKKSARTHLPACFSEEQAPPAPY